MKNLFFTFTLLTSLSLSAQNLVNNGDFSQEVNEIVTNPSEAIPAKWFILNNEEKGISNISYVHDENQSYNGCMQIDNAEGEGNIAWYKVLVGQRLKNAGIEKGIYRLSFEAKAISNEAKVNVYIKKTIEKEGKDPLTYKVGPKWKKVYVDFNTAKVINNYNSKKAIKGLAVTDSDESILNDCYIAIQCLNKGESVRIDNVKFEKIN